MPEAIQHATPGKQRGLFSPSGCHCLTLASNSAVAATAGDDVTATALKAIKSASAEEARDRAADKAAKKAAFDSEYDVGGYPAVCRMVPCTGSGYITPAIPPVCPAKGWIEHSTQASPQYMREQHCVDGTSVRTHRRDVKHCCGDDAVGGKGIKEAAGDSAPAARTAKDAEAKAEDDVEVRTVLLICYVCYAGTCKATAR